MASDKPNSDILSLDETLKRFSSGSSRQRRSLIPSIETNARQIADLGASCLSPYDMDGDDWSAGWILQCINRHAPEALSEILPSKSYSWLSAQSSVGIDYDDLQKYLIKESFEEADRITSSILRKLAGPQSETRGYVYFSEVEYMPNLDLITLDRLWNVFSQGRFGFSVQARLLSSLNGRYELLWPRIGWKVEGVWTRYPSAFDWSISAPEGHMPLINQLRGVRLMDALLKHPALASRS